MSIVNIQSSSNSVIPLEVIQLNNTLLNMISSNQEYFLGTNRVYYYAVSDEILLLLENTQLNKQIIDNYAIDFDATRLFSLKFTSRVNGALEYGVQDVLYSLGSSIQINNLDQINALIYSKTNSYIRGAELIGNDFDANEVILYDSNNKLKTSNILSSDLVRISPIQTITGEKTFTGGVKLTNLNQITSSVAKVLIKNQATNAIEEATVNAVVNSSSTATPISIEATKFQTYKLYNANLSDGHVLLTKNTETFVSWGLSDVVYTNTGISLTNNQITISKAGLYTFELELDMLKWGASSSKDAGTITVYSYVNQLLLFNEFKSYYLEASDYEQKRVVFFYNKFDNTQISFSFSVYHNINNSPISGEPTGGLLLQKSRTFVNITYKGVDTTLGNVLNDTTASNTTLMVKTDGTIVKNNNLTTATILDTASNQTITGVKTFESNDLRLNPITTAAANTNKLITRKQADGTIEETNLAVSSLATLDTAQTITGVKTFSDTTKIEKLYCNGLFARQSITNNGFVSWTGRYLSWSNKVSVIPINSPELASTGHITLLLPAVGQNYTVFNKIASNTSSTVAMTANGFDFGIGDGTADIWTALYYKIDISQNNTAINTNYILVHYLNTAWEPDATWILLAVGNTDTNALKWMPGLVSIPAGGSYDATSGQLTKSIYSRWMSANVAVVSYTWVSAVFNGSAISNSNINDDKIPITTSDGITFTNNSPGTRQYLITWNVYLSAVGSVNYTRLFTTDGVQLGVSNISDDVASSSAIVSLSPNKGFKIQVFQNSGNTVNIVSGVNASALQIHCLN